MKTVDSLNLVAFGLLAVAIFGSTREALSYFGVFESLDDEMQFTLVIFLMVFSFAFTIPLKYFILGGAGDE